MQPHPAGRSIRQRKETFHEHQISRRRIRGFAADGDRAHAAARGRHDHRARAQCRREPQNWILHHGNYQGHRFSALKEINTDNVKNLKLAFTVALGGFEGGGRYTFGNLEATPIVEDGIMYVPDGWGSVYAIDVTSGKKGTFKWKFDPGTDQAWAGDVACCGVNNRGVALWKDKVISIALDGRMFAINKATGEMVWERKIADPALGETLTLAPLVVRDIAIVGAAGGEFGIRGYIEATDLNTGKQAWRTYTIPGAGEPGNETWKDGKERWKHGGGSVWETATYDADTDTFYQGIGNAGPDYDVEYRPGDNKWAASVLALSPSDGKIKWGFQYTPQRPLRLRRNLRAPDHQRQGQRRGPQARRARGAQRLLLRARPHQRLVRRRQAICRPADLDDGPRSEDRQAAQLRSDQGRAGLQPRQPRHARPGGGDAPVRPIAAARTGSPPPTIPSSTCSTCRRSKAATSSTTVEQKDFVDQGGTVKPRERFTGGSTKNRRTPLRRLKAVDPTTGETKAKLRLTYPNYSRRARDRRQPRVPRPLRRHLLGL